MIIVDLSIARASYLTDMCSMIGLYQSNYDYNFVIANGIAHTAFNIPPLTYDRILLLGSKLLTSFSSSIKGPQWQSTSLPMINRCAGHPKLKASQI